MKNNDTRNADLLLQREFGEKVRHFRELRGMTQQEVADAVGMSRVTITNIELGGQNILLGRILSISAAIGVSPSSLLPGSDTTPDDKKVVDHLSAIQSLQDELCRKRAELAEKDKILAYISFHMRKWNPPK